VHELGHLVAMHLFGYKNLRMFFIPFLGAAVIGKAHYVAGWKKAIVSLAGPIPGILIGVIAAIIGVHSGSTLLLHSGYLFAFLNGINLLPIIPADGGWLLHALLCTRRPYLDIILRVVAVIGLLWLGWILDNALLLLLILPILFSLSSTWRIAVVANHLHGMGLMVASSDSMTIPSMTAAVIRHELQERSPRVTNPAQVRSYIATIFDLISTPPTGWAFSLFLLTIYLAAFFTAHLTCLTCSIGLRYDVADVMDTLRGYTIPAVFCAGVLLVTGILATLTSRHNQQPAAPTTEKTISTPPVPPPPSEFNAFDSYHTAGELLNERDRIVELQFTRDEVVGIHLKDREKLLRVNTPVLSKVREGFAYPYQYPRVTECYGASPLINACHPIVYLFGIDARVKIACSNFAGAVQSCVDGIRFAITIPNGGTMQNHLTGVACERIVHSTLRPLVKYLTAEQAQQTCRVVETIERLRTPFSEVVEEEISRIFRWVNEMVEHPDQVVAHLPEGAKDHDIYLKLAELPRAELEVVRMQVADFLDALRPHMMQPYACEPIWGIDTPDTSSRDLLHSLGNDLQAMHLQETEARIQSAFTVLHLATQAYRLDHPGNRPAGLEELVTEYLTAVPIDPFTKDSPIGYLLEESTCTFFSAGPDGKDAQQYRLKIVPSR